MAGELTLCVVDLGVLEVAGRLGVDGVALAHAVVFDIAARACYEILCKPLISLNNLMFLTFAKHL